MSCDVADIETRLLLEAIYLRYGYDLREYRDASIRRRAAAALAASGAENMCQLVDRTLRDREAFADVLDALTVRVTDLFRDPRLYLALRARVIPILRTYPVLKVWHAGCATGEEAYASAILLREEGLSGRAQLYGTDLSQRAIQQAKEGVYPETRLRAFAENHAAAGGAGELSRWITAAYGNLVMCDGLRKDVVFFHHDLVVDHVFGEMNVVFCRNVLIYFGAELRERVLGKIAESLCPGGFLCIGTSERLTGATPTERRFVPFVEEERIYRYEP